MASETALKIERLSKVYKIGSRTRHDTLRDQLADGIRSLFKRRDAGRQEAETFWALDDVSMEVKKGEVVGVIGRNGAGKSTLLKILSRITEPTKGRATIHGKVGSLLEVGTGFHPELTGRENIYLNGAILGMKNAEINRKFDEIVAFSEVEKFIETPVKRYSSGMYVRLAFAVAAHLEPEVLIIDEVLAVGDTAFQTKCLGKIGEVATQGRTVLFVSHNMAAVQHLCQKVFLLQKGKLVFTGAPREAIDFYVNSYGAQPGTESHIVELWDAAGRPSTYHRMLMRMELYTEGGNPVNGSLPLAAPLKVVISFRMENAAPTMDTSLRFVDQLGQAVLTISSLFQKERPGVDTPGDYTFVCEIPSFTLFPGVYKMTVFIDVNGTNVDRVEDAFSLRVVDTDYYGGGKLPHDGFLVLKNYWYAIGALFTTLLSHCLSEPLAAAIQ